AVLDFVFELAVSPLPFKAGPVESGARANPARGNAQAQSSAATAQPVPNQLRFPAPRFCMLLNGKPRSQERASPQWLRDSAPENKKTQLELAS
ncbi:MAG: hypothetical protein WA676_04810, partial [Candidatus Sulfotelmatobacter sp.]